MTFEKTTNRAVFQPLDSRRLFAFGQIDAGFGDLGHAVTQFTQSLVPAAIEDLHVVLPGGSILAGGDAGIVRYTPDGDLDPTYGDGGIVSLAGAFFRAQALDSHNNLYTLLVGSSGTVVSKFNSSGQPDSTFGTGGTALVTNLNGFAAKAIAVDEDGRVIVAGTQKMNVGNTGVRVYRLEDNGDPDLGFGDDGASDFQLGPTGAAVTDRVVGITVVDDDQILIGGGTICLAGSSQFPNGAFFAMARLKDDGKLDDDYGVDGISRTVYKHGGSLADALTEYGTTRVLPGAFTVTPDGSALLAAGDGGLALASFDADGHLIFNTHAEAGFPLDLPTDATVLADGRFAIVGQPREGEDHHGLVMTYVTQSGTVGNAVFTDDLIADTTDLTANSPGAIATSADGRMLVGGGASIDAGGFEVARFSAGAAGDARPDDFADGTVNDIAKDADGGLHLAFFDSRSTTLKYAYRAPNGLWTDPVEVDSTPGSGGYLSIAVNSARLPLIAYFSGATADLKLATASGTARIWSTETIDSKGSVGQYPSLVVDSGDRPRISYYRKTSGDLRFATLLRKGWRVQTIDGGDGRDVGRSSSLLVNPRTGLSAVAYTDGSMKQIKYAGQGKLGDWGIVTAAKFKSGADHLSMAFSYYFGAIISYYDTRTTDLKVAYYTGADGWQGKVIGSDTAQGLYTAITFPDYYGDPSIYAWDRATNSVVLHDESTAIARSTNLVTGGGEFLSVAYDGVSTDIAYLDTTAGLLKVRWTQAPEAD